MTRPQVSVFVGVSLDGFLARRDGTLDFLDGYGNSDHGYQAFFDAVDTVAMGRGTYDFLQGVVAGGIAWPMTGRRCLVLTHRPVDGRHGERAFAGEPPELLEMLAAEGARHVYIDGGVVIRSFLARDLVDRMVVSVVPELIGEGLPLFGGVRLEGKLELESSEAYPDGLVQLRYRRRS